MGDTSDPTRVAVSDPRPSGAFVLQHRPDAVGGPVLEAVDTPALRRQALADTAEEASAAAAPAPDDAVSGREEEI